jgi:hypothetical protein
MNLDPAETERFMIFESVIQWTQAVAVQSDRVAAAQTAQFQPGRRQPENRLAGMNFRSECDYFAVAVDMLFKFRKRAKRKKLFASIDFSEIDGLTAEQDRIDIRNMRMHVTDCLQGRGKDQDRWFVETPDFKADASSTVGALIGGRLDWAALGAAAKRLLPKLRKWRAGHRFPGTPFLVRTGMPPRASSDAPATSEWSWSGTIKSCSARSKVRCAFA